MNGVELAETNCTYIQPSNVCIPAFSFRTAEGDILKCWRCAFIHRPMLVRSFIAALVVGTVLSLINQGDLILTGDLSRDLLWKIPLTYTVPFLVASYGALVNSFRRR